MLKIFIIFIYTISLRVLSFLFIVNLDWHYVFWAFIFVMFLLEIGLIFSKKFRNWIKIGIEGNDGSFDKSDLKELLLHYSTLWCIRLFVLFGLLEAFYGIQVREIFVLGSLAGAFGAETASYFTRKKLKSNNDNRGSN